MNLLGTVVCLIIGLYLRDRAKPYPKLGLLFLVFSVLFIIK